MTIQKISMLAAAVLAAVALSGCDWLITAEGRIERAEARLAEGEYQLAITEAKKALDRDPQSVAARRLLAEASLKLGDYATAEAELQRVIEAGDIGPASEALRVEILLAMGRTNDAAASLAAAARIDAGQRALLEGKVAQASGQPAEAEAAYARALEAAPDSVEARVGRAEAWMAQGRLEAARKELEALISERPGAGLAWLARASLDAREGHFADAAEGFRQAVANGASLSQAQRAQAAAARVEALIQAGDVPAAEQALVELDEVAGGSIIAVLGRARVLLVKGEGRAAVESLQRVVQAMPRQPEPRTMLVEALMQQGSTQQALAEAGKLVGDLPDSEVARLTLAQTQIRAGQRSQAERTLQPLLERMPPSPRALAMAAQLRVAEGEMGAGVAFLERALQADPGNMALRLDLAPAYISSGRGDKAVALLREIPDGPLAANRDRLLIVAIAASQGREQALKEMDRAMAAHPKDAALLTLVASYHSWAGNNDRARSLLEQALASQPGDVQASLALARLEVAGGQLDAAAERARTVLRAEPNQAGALALMTEIARAKGDRAEMERWLEEARRADPEAPVPRLMLLRSALSRGDAAAADALIAELDRQAKQQAMVQSGIGDAMLEARRLDSAIERYRAAIKLDPKLAVAHLGLGRTLAQQGQSAAARTALNTAVALRPDWADASASLAMLEAGAGNRDAALRAVADLKRNDPQGAEPLIVEGDVRWMLGQPREAAAAYEAALPRKGSGVVAARAASARLAAGEAVPERPLVRWLEQNPGDSLARATLASIYMQSGRSRAAVTEYEKVVTAVPNDPISLNNLAWLYQELGDARALELARRAYQEAPQSADIGDTLGWILVRGGKLDEGLKIMRQVAEKATNNGDIQYHYAYALNASGDKAGARSVLQRALGLGNFPSRADAEKLMAELEK